MEAKSKRCDICLYVCCVVNDLSFWNLAMARKKRANVLDVNTTAKLVSHVNLDALTVTKITTHLNDQFRSSVYQVVSNNMSSMSICRFLDVSCSQELLINDVLVIQ